MWGRGVRLEVEGQGGWGKKGGAIRRYLEGRVGGGANITFELCHFCCVLNWLQQKVYIIIF